VSSPATSLTPLVDLNPQLFVDDPADSPFVRVGKAALRRGFAITPLDSQTKKPNMERFNTHPIRTYTGLLQREFDNKNSNVGIVMRHPRYGDCWHFVLDLDGEDMLKRIEDGAGHDLLKEVPTLIVQSQPEKKPWKMHIYLLATEYSAPLLQKEVTGLVGFDLKGTGRGGQVLAAGSIHPSGSIYTYMTDLPIAPIPPWLVDWLVKEIHRQRSEAAKARHVTRVAKAAEKAAKKAQAAANTAEANADKTAEEIAEESEAAEKEVASEVFKLMRSKAGSFAKLSVDREDIEHLLLKQVAKVFGQERADSKKVKDHAHALAFSKHLIIGDQPDFKFGQEPCLFVGVGKERRKIGRLSSDYRSTQLIRLLKTFPDSLTTADAEARVRKEVWPDYDGTKGSHKTALCRARQATDFVVKDGMWTRMTPLVAVIQEKSNANTY
jgi:hypothetical protein